MGKKSTKYEKSKKKERDIKRFTFKKSLNIICDNFN